MVPCTATVAGAPVEILKFDYDGNDRRGLTAQCRGADGRKHAVAASDVIIPVEEQGARFEIGEARGKRSWKRPAAAVRRQGRG